MYASIDKCKYCYLFQLFASGRCYFDNGYSAHVFLTSTDIPANDIGHVYYRSTTDTAILNRASNAVAGSGFAATYVVIFTWHKITFWGGSNTTPVSLLVCLYLLCTTTFCHTSTSHPGDISADCLKQHFQSSYVTGLTIIIAQQCKGRYNPSHL